MADDHPLQKFRARRGWTREALGKELGVTGVTVGRWENRRRSVKNAFLPKIESVTGIKPAVIIDYQIEHPVEAA